MTPSDRLTLMFRHELARYDIPNEQVQQAAGQRQNGDNFENMGIATYQHIFSSNVVGDVRAMVRDNSNGLSSNPLSTPIIAFQRNHFTEGYFNGTVSIHRGNQEWKAGVESDNIFLHEHFADVITDPSQFDPGTPTQVQLCRQSAGPGAVRFCAGPDPPGQLDGQCGRALGPLPAHRQSKCGEPASGDFALLCPERLAASCRL